MEKLTRAGLIAVSAALVSVAAPTAAMAQPYEDPTAENTTSETKSKESFEAGGLSPSSSSEQDLIKWVEEAFESKIKFDAVIGDAIVRDSTSDSD
ncbi:hypothetical protein [Nonomuraea sp. 10N515B]|uniref:hypothetical protein n=1 Tax=Nonomuraea sp. 10N515B TaxID=3457422 RepID=UPI003FCEA907